jgi:hypothetical protein
MEHVMQIAKRWKKAAAFAALLAGVGAALFATLPPQPRLHLEGQYALAITNDGGTLYTVELVERKTAPDEKSALSLKDTLRAWDTRTGEMKWAATITALPPGLSTIELSPDRAWMLYHLVEDRLNVVSLKDGTERILDASGHHWNLVDCRSVNGYAVLTSTAEFRATIIELASGKPVSASPFHDFRGIAPAASRCFFTDVDGSVCVFQLSDRTTSRLPVGRQFLAFSTDGSRIATWKPGMKEGRAIVEAWDAVTAKRLCELPEAEEYPTAHFSPDAKWLVTLAARGKSLEVWDAAGGERRLSLPTNVEIEPDRAGPAEWSGDISPDSRWLCHWQAADAHRLDFISLPDGLSRFRIEDKLCTVGGRYLTSDLMVGHIGWMRGGQNVRRPAPSFERWLGWLSVIRLAPPEPGDETQRGKFALQEWSDANSIVASPDQRHVAVWRTPVRDDNRWLDWAMTKLEAWFPERPREKRDEITVQNLRTGAILCRVEQEDAAPGFLSGDNATLVTRQFVGEELQPSSTVWDVPAGRPWRWIVGVPLALGAAILGVRAAWRRWRAKPVVEQGRQAAP